MGGDLENTLRKIEDYEKSQEVMTRDLERKTNWLEEVKEELRNSQSKVSLLEENKSALLNENVILKNEAKVLNQRKKENGSQMGNSPVRGLNEEQEEADGTNLRKESEEPAIGTEEVSRLHLQKTRRASRNRQW